MLDVKFEAARCLLCADGACDSACKKGFKPSRMLRSAYFEICQRAADFCD